MEDNNIKIEGLSTITKLSIHIVRGRYRNVSLNTHADNEN
jgi:hypothetical protein